jgi:site-specific DNA recombinase
MAAARSWRAGTGPGAGGLAAWAERSGRRRAEGTGSGGLRFAFYGRVSTEDWQDPESSLARQLGQAEALIRGHGRIAAKFSDVGESRTVAWGRRPQAAVIIAALADPGRGWDAVVVGEYERAWSENRTLAGHVFRVGGGLCRRLPGAERRAEGRGSVSWRCG